MFIDILLQTGGKTHLALIAAPVFHDIFGAVSSHRITRDSFGIIYGVKEFAVRKIKVIPVDLTVGFIRFPEVCYPFSIFLVAFVEVIAGQVPVIVGPGIVGFRPVERCIASSSERVRQGRCEPGLCINGPSNGSASG